MKPQRMHLVAVFVLLLTSVGFAQSQEDARDAPNRLGDEEAFSKGGTLTVWDLSQEAAGFA